MKIGRDGAGRSFLITFGIIFTRIAGQWSPVRKLFIYIYIYI